MQRYTVEKKVLFQRSDTATRKEYCRKFSRRDGNIGFNYMFTTVRFCNSLNSHKQPLSAYILQNIECAKLQR